MGATRRYLVITSEQIGKIRQWRPAWTLIVLLNVGNTIFMTEGQNGGFYPTVRLRGRKAGQYNPKSIGHAIEYNPVQPYNFIGHETQ